MLSETSGVFVDVAEQPSSMPAAKTTGKSKCDFMLFYKAREGPNVQKAGPGGWDGPFGDDMQPCGLPQSRQEPP